MRLRPLLLSMFAVVALATPLALRWSSLREARLEEREVGPYPSDWFGVQRAFPSGTIAQDKWTAALEQARLDRELAEGAGGGAAALNSGALTWQQAGPYNIGGRVTALASVPGGVTVYLGAANGGVFKSTDSGTHWTPIFDMFGEYSIGALALAPGSSTTLYVGGGEANGSVDSYDGHGVFRTTDGGVTWESLGLAATARIARIAVDPLDPNHLLVATMGRQFSTGPDRGLYRSLDGGATWTRVLAVNDSTGASDVVFNPIHPDTVYAATWERVRRSTYRRAYGPGTGVWRSIDRGLNWTRLTNGLPAPSDNVGRIALALCAASPRTVYAQITTGATGGYTGLGMYRSLDGGDSWARRDASGFTGIFGGFSWYFGDMAVDPVNPNRVWALGVSLARSTDGGVTFTSQTGSAHVDQHAIWIDPTNPSRTYIGNDGGFFSTVTGGVPWTKSLDLPITQFYAGAIAPQNRYRLLGGTQDNNTLITAGSPSAWYAVLGGDGFQCLVDPVDSNVVFAEYQYGCYGSGPQRATDGGSLFIPPGGFDANDRYNWNAPIVMDPADHNVVLSASQRVYKSIDNGQTYVAISGDLTTNPGAAVVYGTIAALEISPADHLTYYAGTDDGRVWRSTDAGGNWTEITAGLPLRSITRVTADPIDAGTVYVTLSGFGSDEHLPHVYRSIDRGSTWSPIAGNLPDAPANDLVVDPADHNTLYLATDLGVYATRNLGAGWFPLGQGMPLQTVFDLTLHAPSRTLVAATHGRSQWRLDLAPLPTATSPGVSPERLALSAPAPNPSRGAVRLTLTLPAANAVEAAVYDAAGRRVATLAHGARAAGTHALAWDGADARGHRAAAGVYFVRASAGGAIATRRVVLSD
jgi:photosystem II stability/assembly factor-like uncharacterized protein